MLSERADATAARRRLHPLTLLFRALEEAQGFVLPALLGGAWAGGGHMARMAGWILMLVVVPSVLWALAEYVAFRFRLEAAELVLDFGVLRRHHRVIPLARVQSVDVRQTALQRLFGVAELHVETAGGEATEAALSVLAVSEADAMRATLLSSRRVVEPATVEEAPRMLAHLSARDLALAGATSNQAGVIAALLIGAAELAHQLGLWKWPGLDLPALLSARPAIESLGTGALLLAVILPLAWAFSVAGALVRYHGFTVERTGEALRNRYGALARREASLPLTRIQAVRVRESLLRRPLGLAALEVETAGAAPGQAHRRGVEPYLPLTRTQAIPHFAAAVLPQLTYTSLRFRPVHPFARRRAFVRYAAALLAVSAMLVYVSGPAWAWLAAFVPLAWIAAGLHVRHVGYAIAPGYLAIRTGFLTRTTWLIPERRVQTVHLLQSAAQRRFGLATLVVDTAAGAAKVVDLEASEARALVLRLSEAVSGRTIGNEKGASPLPLLAGESGEDGAGKRAPAADGSTVGARA